MNEWMSLVKFDPALMRPELRPTTEVLERWLRDHQERSFIYPASLYRDIGAFVTPQNLIRVLAQLVAANQLVVKFRVLLPDGTLSEAEFDDPRHVPEVVFDSSFEPVEVTDDRIVTVYRLADDHGR